MKLKLSIKKIFPEGAPARYNVAAWQKSDKDHVVLVGREIYEPGKENVPDKGKLVLFEIDEENRIVHERILWDASQFGFYLEDPRALVHSDGSITIGLTAVISTDAGYKPFPAVVKIRSGKAWTGELPPITIIHAFGEGKNLTPIRKNTFLFRPESPEYHHKLKLFNLKESDPGTSYDIEFPTKLKWALWRIGTTMPPLWTSKNQAISSIDHLLFLDY